MNVSPDPAREAHGDLSAQVLAVRAQGIRPNRHAKR
jgi:hypothetical protein